jgi:hypothetical protein
VLGNGGYGGGYGCGCECGGFVVGGGHGPILGLGTGFHRKHRLRMDTIAQRVLSTADPASALMVQAGLWPVTPSKEPT